MSHLSSWEIFDISEHHRRSEESEYATSATSVSSEIPMNKAEDTIRRTCGVISSNAPKLTMVLDFLNDMALEENAQMEKCLRDASVAISTCVGYNTCTVLRNQIFPAVRTHGQRSRYRKTGS